MTGAVMDFPLPKVGNPRLRGLDKSFRDAVADYLRGRWPQHAAKSAAREFDLSLDKAKEAVRGNASLTTVEKIFKEGGLAVALPVLEEVVGVSIAHHLREVRTIHEERGKRLAALVGDRWPLGADRPGGDPDTAGTLDSWDRPAPHRSARDSR